MTAVADTRFGTIAIGGETGRRDAAVRPPGAAVKRRKTLSKKIYAARRASSG